MSRLDDVLERYRIVSNDDFVPHTERFKEAESVWHGLKFLTTRYFRDPKIRKLKEEHTEAVHEEYVNNDHMPYNLAVKLARSTPMPSQTMTGKGIICLGWGLFGPGRTYPELVKLASKYSRLNEKWLVRGSIAAELTWNNWTGTLAVSPVAFGIDYSVNTLYSAITGQKERLPVTEVLLSAYIGASYVETLRATYRYEKKGEYTHNPFLWTRFPGNVLFQLLAYKYHIYLKNKKNEITL